MFSREKDGRTRGTLRGTAVLCNLAWETVARDVSKERDVEETRRKNIAELIVRSFSGEKQVRTREIGCSNLLKLVAAGPDSYDNIPRTAFGLSQSLVHAKAVSLIWVFRGASP